MTPRSRLAAIALIACTGLVTTFSNPAAADDAAAAPKEARKEASERFRRGVKLYRDADYVAALIEFKRAYALSPNYRVLYNLGQTSRELKDYAAALTSYRQYLEEGGKKIKASRRAEVRTAIDDLVERVGTLSIATNVEGAEIQIDDEVMGRTPLEEPVVVNIGKRRVSATLPGHVPASRVIEVASRDELDVDLELVSLDRKNDGPNPQPGNTKSVDESELPVAGIVALAVTGACGVATGVLGGLALSAKGERDDALATLPGDPQRIQSAVDETSNLALATDVMLGVTAAGAITTLVLFIVAPGASDEKDPPEDVEVSLAPSLGGLWLLGTF